MSDSDCPNFNTCKLVNSNEIILAKDVLDHYISEYCMNKNNWRYCKRYITKNTLNFCPDFVLPDTRLTPDEIIEKFDNDLY